MEGQYLYWILCPTIITAVMCIVIILSCMWFQQGTCRGETGYFPASYVHMVSPGNQVFQALYDLVPEAPGDLQLTEGQVSVCVCV